MAQVQMLGRVVSSLRFRLLSVVILAVLPALALLSVASGRLTRGNDLASDAGNILMAALVAGIAAWVVGGFLLVRPIRALTEATRRLAAGELGARAGAGDAPGELAELARAFDEMAAALQARERDRSRAADALIKSHDRFQLVARATNDAIWDWNVLTDEVWWGEGFARLFGHEEPPTIDAWTEAVHPDDRARIVEGLDRVVNGGGTHWSDEYRYQRADGTFALVFDRGYVQRDANGKPLRMLGAMTDVTERRAAEARLRRSYGELRALSARLAAVREEEGRRISREIHDGLGQSLTALKMDVAWLRRRATDPDGTVFESRLRDMSRAVDELMETVHRVSMELRPGLLDDLGLAAAIEWQVEDFAKRSGIRGSVRLGNPVPAPGGEISTAAFRILQEALTNVARHSKATRVAVGLEREDGMLVLRVEDDGRGITEREQKAPRALGLIGMRERAALVGGTVDVVGRAGEGTVITVRLPMGGAAAAGVAG